MKKLFVFAKRTKELQTKDTIKIIGVLKDYGCEIFIDILGIPETVYTENPEKEVPSCDFLVVLGGDGSLLGVARQFAPYGIPILGINLGRLGYLIELEKNNLSSLKDLFSGNYRIEERLMLEAKAIRNGKTLFSGIALNDAVVSKGAISRMVQLNVSADGQLVNRYFADGLVLATPTGSTAYSMSAGGSVVSPALKVILLTPICPHSLACKPIIVSDTQKIDVEVTLSSGQEAMLTLDGQIGFSLSAGDLVEVTKSEYKTKLIRLNERNFFQILKNKLEENR